MATQLSFDQRLWNTQAVENLRLSHPALHDRLRVWFGAQRDFDEKSLVDLVNAKGPDEVARYRETGEAALDEARLVAMSLAMRARRDSMMSLADSMLKRKP